MLKGKGDQGSTECSNPCNRFDSHPKSKIKKQRTKKKLPLCLSSSFSGSSVQ